MYGVGIHENIFVDGSLAHKADEGDSSTGNAVVCEDKGKPSLMKWYKHTRKTGTWTDSGGNE